MSLSAVGTDQYVDLGDLTDSCIDNLDLCSSSGVTLSFRLLRRGGTFQNGQVVLSGRSYDISFGEDSRYTYVGGFSALCVDQYWGYLSCWFEVNHVKT